MKGLKAWPPAERPNAHHRVLELSHHGRHRRAHGAGRGCGACWLRYAPAVDGSAAAVALGRADGPAGFVAVLAGWITTEVGRQPYTVYGLLRTAQSRLADRRRRPWRPRCWPSSSSTSLVFGAGIFYILRLMAHTPQLDEPDIETGVPQRAAGITPRRR